MGMCVGWMGWSKSDLKEGRRYPQYIQCTFSIAISPLFVSHIMYLAVGYRDHPSPCVLSLVQLLLKGRAAVIHSQGYSCGSESRAACKNASCIKEKKD